MEDSESNVKEAVVSELLSYDLPTQREKNFLECYESDEKVIVPMLKDNEEENPEEWDKLKKKQDETSDKINPIVLGKTKPTGKLPLHVTHRIGICKYQIMKSCTKYHHCISRGNHADMQEDKSI